MSSATPEPAPAVRSRRSAARAGVLACLVWLGLWYLTPGLLAEGWGRRLAAGLRIGGLDRFSVGVLAESVIAVIILALLLVCHRHYNRSLLARSRFLPLYGLPVVLAAALPFHYGMDLPLGVYLAWMTVSVFWQDYLTFGLLQTYLRGTLPPWATIMAVAFMFWLGHFVFLPHRFGLDNVLASLAMVGMGALFAGIRARTGTLHLLLALHLSFYFVFA